MDDPLDRLERLAQLREQGHLSSDEYEALKAKALAGEPAPAGQRAQRSAGQTIVERVGPLVQGTVLVALLAILAFLLVSRAAPPEAGVPSVEEPRTASPMLTNSHPIPSAPAGWRRITTADGGSILRTDDSRHVKPGDTFLGWGCTSEGLGTFFLGRSWSDAGFGRSVDSIAFRFDNRGKIISAPALPVDSGLVMIDMTTPQLVRRFQGAYSVDVYFTAAGGVTERRSFDLTGSRRISEGMAADCVRR